MRIARLLIYEGSDTALDNHMAQAKNDGRHKLGQHTGGLHESARQDITLRVITLPNSFLAALDEMRVMNQTEAL